MFLSSMSFIWALKVLIWSDVGRSRRLTRIGYFCYFTDDFWDLLSFISSTGDSSYILEFTLWLSSG